MFTYKIFRIALILLGVTDTWCLLIPVIWGSNKQFYVCMWLHIFFRIATLRGEAVSREVLKSVADNKKMPKQEKDERWVSQRLSKLQITRELFQTFCRILWKKNEVADYEATTFSIFYNNALFLLFVIFMSFYVLRNFTAELYPFHKLNIHAV